MRSPQAWWKTVRWLPLSIREAPRWLRAVWYVSNVISWSPLFYIPGLHRANMALSDKLYKRAWERRDGWRDG